MQGSGTWWLVECNGKTGYAPPAYISLFEAGSFAAPFKAVGTSEHMEWIAREMLYATICVGVRATDSRAWHESHMHARSCVPVPGAERERAQLL